jgi:hypothetical protein
MINKKETRPYDFFSFETLITFGTAGTGSSVSLNNVTLLENTFNVEPRFTSASCNPAGTIITYTIDNFLSIIGAYDPYSIEVTPVKAPILTGLAVITGSQMTGLVYTSNVTSFYVQIRSGTGGSFNFNTSARFIVTLKKYYGDTNYYLSMPSGVTPSVLNWSTLLYSESYRNH